MILLNWSKTLKNEWVDIGLEVKHTIYLSPKVGQKMRILWKLHCEIDYLKIDIEDISRTQTFFLAGSLSFTMNSIGFNWV